MLFSQSFFNLECFKPQLKSKEYIITYQGKTFEIKNLRAFAIKNKLDQGNLCKVAQKKINSLKGYIVSYK